MRQFVCIAALVLAASAASVGGRADYIGGTSADFDRRVSGRLVTTGVETLQFVAKGKSVAIAYDRIHTLEYGQKVDRRYVSAVLVSPLFLLAKSRKHFLTLGYNDSGDREQALIFQVDKSDVRAVLASLEARTGRKVTYQDQEARKAGKG
ncbi:MAG: hypothetical protein FJW38_06775 [Acidobacteria bacterium]|nr:hypothetical protein [Acidobacteriota bacterium]